MSLTNDETSEILNQSLSGRSYSFKEILDLGKNNKYQMRKIKFGPKIKEYTPILHFFPIPNFDEKPSKASKFKCVCIKEKCQLQASFGA